ncbi:cyclic nucleotide-binding domain-containing protein [Stutzerimonas marianensis]|uniref:cyclic nucleotide-binding domain-containing protein n=1 Tax=Stutzerimonas marianensis TaxID=2929513 RepID=UPI003C2BCC1B
MNKPLHADQISHLFPLNALAPRQLQQLRDQLTPRALGRGEALFEAGSGVNATYFLLKGALALSGPGGERSLVADSPEGRRALVPGASLQSAHATEDSSVLMIDSQALERLLSRQQADADLLLELASTGELTDWLEELLDNPLFAKVPVENVRQMLGRLHEIELPAGYVLLREGDAGDCCYFLKRGRAEVITGLGGNRQVVAELAVGACFGEEALLSDAPRNATVSLIEDGAVLRLARQDFLALLQAPVVAEVELDEAEALLEQGAQWLDVRLTDEYERGHAAQALNMPLHLLRLKTRLLAPERVYLCYCDSGKRSANGVFLLAQLGFRAYGLRGGLNALSCERLDRFLCEQGSGYLARSGGRTERSG